MSFGNLVPRLPDLFKIIMRNDSGGAKDEVCITKCLGLNLRYLVSCPKIPCPPILDVITDICPVMKYI